MVELRQCQPVNVASEVNNPGGDINSHCSGFRSLVLGRARSTADDVVSVDTMQIIGCSDLLFDVLRSNPSPPFLSGILARFRLSNADAMAIVWPFSQALSSVSKSTCGLWRLPLSFGVSCGGGVGGNGSRGGDMNADLVDGMATVTER